MKITIEPDSSDVEYIRSHWQALNVVKSFLQALGISEADRERWDDVLWAEIDTSSTIEFEGMTCYFPDTIRNQQSWKYSTRFYNSGYLLLLNGTPFWATMTNTNAVDDLPSDLINFSCTGWPFNDLSQSFNKLNQLKSLNLYNSRTLTNITPIENLTQLNSLNLSDCRRLSDITPIKKLTLLNSLNLQNCNSLSNSESLENLIPLTSLNLSGCKSLTDITPLGKLAQLISLDLSYCKSLTDITPLGRLALLTSLDLSYCDSLTNITPLGRLALLTSLNLSGCKSLTDITPLGKLALLTSLDLSYCDSLTDITTLGKLKQLTTFNFSGFHILNYKSFAGITDITPLGKLKQLTSLNLSDHDSLADITPLGKLEQLTSLDLSRCESLTDITPLGKLEQLTSLNLSYCGSLTDIRPLGKLQQLTSLNLLCCESLTDIRPLGKLEQLTSLDLSYCKSMTDITPLVKLAQLTSLNLSYCKSMTDITPLVKLEQLTSLDLSYCDSLTDITPLKIFSKINSLNLSYCNLISNLFPIQFIHQIKTISIEGCLRITQFPNFKQLNYLYELNSSLHPTTVADILAHCALSREDWSFIKQNADPWTAELQSGLKDTHPAALDLATSLAIAFPRISFELSERLCQILQTDPLLDYRPWKQLFLGLFVQMGFSTLQNLASTIAAGSFPRGAIGGLSAIAEQLITLADGKEWFAGWVRATSAQHESNPSFLKPVAAPWCLALHCLGEHALLDQWIARFTDPDDSSALDAVFLEFGNHRLGHNNATGAFRHAMRIRATLVRDGLLADIASHYLEAQQADQAAELLFLLSAEDKRAELSLKLADIPHFLDNRDNLHRLLAACGKNAPAIGKMLAKAGMDETAFPSDADDKRQRAVQDAAKMASIRTGLGAAYVGELSDLITQFLKNKAYTP
jgi:Leucine-rich repeat (LRR) protein